MFYFYVENRSADITALRWFFIISLTSCSFSASSCCKDFAVTSLSEKSTVSLLFLFLDREWLVSSSPGVKNSASFTSETKAKKYIRSLNTVV